MDDSVRGADFVLRMRERVRGGMREPTRELNHLVADAWDALVRGVISDDQAQGLFADIQARRDEQSREGEQLGAALPSIKLPVPDSEPKAVPAPDSEFQIAERERRQKRIARRRRLGALCSMPAEFFDFFSTAQQAVLSQIVVRCRDHGRCDLAVATIAARANVSERTVQTTVRKASHLNLLKADFRRRKTTILTVLNEAWREFLKRRRRLTGNQKSLLLEESMDPLLGAKIVRQTVSEGSKVPSRLDHLMPAMAGVVDVLETVAPAPRPKRIERVATPSVEDRLASARRMVEESAQSRPTGDIDDGERPKPAVWMMKRDRLWLANWKAAERLDAGRYPGLLTDRGAVRMEVLDWLGRQWGSAGTDQSYGFRSFSHGTKTEIRIGFRSRTMIAEFRARWGGTAALIKC